MNNDAPTDTGPIELAEGETTSYSAFAEYEDGSEEDVTDTVSVTSADETVVSVDESAAIIVGEGGGSTTVTADDGQYQETIEFEVRDTSTATLDVGETASYSAFAEFDNGSEINVTDTVSVTSSDTSVVSVDEVANTVTGQSGGESATVTADDDQYQETITVSVDFGEVSVSANGGTLPVGGEVDIGVPAENVDELIITNLWKDWSVDIDVPTDIIGDTVTENGTVTLSWQTVQSSVSPTVSVSIPDRYVGGEYLVDVSAAQGEEVKKTTATITIE